MENAQRITIASRRLRRICAGLIWLLPIACAIFWISFNRIRHLPSMSNFPVPVTGDLSGQIRFFAFLVEMIPLAALLYGLRKLGELFRYYEDGLIFAKQNVACFRSLGRALIAWVICDVVKNSLISIVLTLNNPPGQHMLTLGFSSSEFTGIFVGIVILIITWVMDEARKIKEDQELFI